MLDFSTVDLIREQVKSWRSQNFSIAFVPTMGNLHAGHLALVEEAKKLADKVIVSIYVNPLQFGENEDFDAYPRTLEKDQNALINAGVDALFLPSTSMMYPSSKDDSSQVYVPGISDVLCGKFRPDHFTGVATIVCKFFNIVKADLAIFGEKDFQQVAVIKKMVTDLFIPIRVHTLPIIREDDGLAMSSRNQYLSVEQRNIAPKLYQTMELVRNEVKRGLDYREAEQLGLDSLKQYGFQPEYMQISHQETLAPAISSVDKNTVLLVAVRLGETRLIDNLLLSFER